MEDHTSLWCSVVHVNFFFLLLNILRHCGTEFGKVGGLWVCVLAADSSQTLGEMKLFITATLVYSVLCWVQFTVSKAKYSKNDVTVFQYFLEKEHS